MTKQELAALLDRRDKLVRSYGNQNWLCANVKIYRRPDETDVNQMCERYGFAYPEGFNVEQATEDILYSESRPDDIRESLKGIGEAWADYAAQVGTFGKFGRSSGWLAIAKESEFFTQLENDIDLDDNEPQELARLIFEVEAAEKLVAEIEKMRAGIEADLCRSLVWHIAANCQPEHLLPGQLEPDTVWEAPPECPMSDAAKWAAQWLGLPLNRETAAKFVGAFDTTDDAIFHVAGCKPSEFLRPNLTAFRAEYVHFFTTTAHKHFVFKK